MKLLKILLASVLVLGLSVSTLSASSKKGQKIFILKFKAPCGFDGAKFAAKHSQQEWQNIKDNGNFKKEFMKICPNVKQSDIKDGWVPHLFDFSYEYANDSGNVPSC
ncbi:MAG: cytochrome C [Campylobacterota bacterium]